MKLSPIRKKVNSSLIVRKRIPSYLRKEKINLTKNNNNFDKKSVKYNQVPQFVQEIKKFTKKNGLLHEEYNNSEINKNKYIYLNNLLNEIPKNKTLLTSSLIHDIYRCLYKLNYIKIDVFCTLFSILINNTINFTKISGYVHCDFKELINITKYLYHFQNICNSNIQTIINDCQAIVNLRIVQRFLNEYGKNNPSSSNTHNGKIQTYIYNYIVKYKNIENVDILLYALLKRKQEYALKGVEKNKVQVGDENFTILKKNLVLDKAIVTKDKNRIQQSCKNDTLCIYPSNEGNHEIASDVETGQFGYLNDGGDGNVKSVLHTEEEQENLIVDYINSFYKLNDMFNFLLNKVLSYFNEHTHIFDFYHLKLLFFFLGKFKKYDVNLLEKITNRIIEEIEKIKTNPKLLHNDSILEEKQKYNYASNRIKKLRKKYLNTFFKIDSKEFLTIPYTIGLSMNTYFNNYLIEYVNIYILSLINSRVNCDMVNFVYCLIGYKHIMLHFFILFNIFLFKEKCKKNPKILTKYSIFFNRLVKNGERHDLEASMGKTRRVEIDQTNQLSKTHLMQEIDQTENSFIHFNSTHEEDNKRVPKNADKLFNCDIQLENLKNLYEETNCINNLNFTHSNYIKLNDKMDCAVRSPEDIFNLLLKEFQMNVNNIFLINFDKHSMYQTYNSEQLGKFYFHYKKLFNKVFNYAIFLLNKYDPDNMLRIYKNLKSHSLNDEIVKQLYIEVLYEKIVFNSENKKKVSSLLKCISNE
ncbi:hypothetical protein, conserved [Plasmodium gonderi]|uniref:Uncharacterized protein n=1 Tax=Plasmodium gonderi TaxID=77519 RepID=A0A1Y1JDE4_PLAGO|nr:hypothetical protein, conserved [Plasmodium gonderi]GAW80551.1 hypothetical protein, conserved [Plasmodium gonderi]